MGEVLFICSGNYYRSRYAEAIFNFSATNLGVDWRAFSRGLATHLVLGAGDLSIHTRLALMARNIPLWHTGDRPVQLTRRDLERADRVVALKEAEHRSMMREQFPDWETRIEYWTVHDLGDATPGAMLPVLEKQVLEMMEEIADTVARPR